MEEWFELPVGEAVAGLEREYLERLMADARGNLTGAAKKAGAAARGCASD